MSKQICPLGWERVEIESIVSGIESGCSVNGDDRPANESEVGVLKVSCVSEGKFRPEENKVVLLPSEISRVKRAIKRNDVLFSRANTAELVGACGRVNVDATNLYLSDKLWSLVFRDRKRDEPRWFVQALCSSRIRKELIRRATGTSGSMKNISKEVFLSMPILRPSYIEQRKICEVLETWDIAITQATHLLEAKQKLKKGLMQQLLTGKMRFKEFRNSSKHRKSALGHIPADWPLKPLGEVFLRVARKNHKGADHVLTASGNEGLIDQKEYFNRSVAGKNLEGYYLLKKGEFAYNRSSMKGYPYGAIKRLDRYPQGVVSTLYLCFALDRKGCDSDFYRHLFEAGLLNSQLRFIAQVGARAHGLLNVTATDFFAMEIPVPSEKEQIRISEALNSIETEIRLFDAKLDALKTQKRGLMQKLLNGKVRVKVD